MSILTESYMIDHIHHPSILILYFNIHSEALNFDKTKYFTDEIVFCKFQNKPAKSSYKVTYNQGSRRSLKKLRNTLVHNHYRNDLKQVNISF